MLTSSAAIRANGATALNDSILQGLKMLEGKERAALVAFTDGYDANHNDTGPGSKATPEEMFAAVGQTVASLSHGIKNIMTGLEGGMYVTSTGLRKGDHERIQRGWDMLERNMQRISSLAKDLLTFSRGEKSKPKLVDPAEIVHEVAALYQDLAKQSEVTIQIEIAGVRRPHQDMPVR